MRENANNQENPNVEEDLVQKRSQELKMLQAYPLEIKESLSADRIRELAREYEFYVSFSGGKDSEVAVDFAAKTVKRLGHSKLYVLNINTGLEYMSVQRFCKPFCELVSKKCDIEVILDTAYPETRFDQVLTHYGYPLISKEVSQCIYEARRGIKNGDGTYSYRIEKLNGTKLDKDGNLSQYNMPQYKFLLDAPFRISNNCCKKVKKEPAYAYEQRTGRTPLIATTTGESRARRTAWIKHGCNSFEAERPISAPFSFWVEQDILEYIKRENLPMADVYGKIIADDKGQIKGQYDFFDNLGDNMCKLCTSGCPRTGCIYCLFGITQDKERILRLQQLEPKRAEYVLRGGKFDKEGMWVPTKEGLGFAFILDWLNKYGNLNIPYNKDYEWYKEIA